MILALLITTAQAAEVSVKVVDSATGAPISQAFLQCDADSTQTVITNAKGQATLPCPKGSHVVSVFHDTYGKKQIPLEIGRDSTSMRLRLDAPSFMIR